MHSPITSSLEDHFTRAWDMILEAASKFSDTAWYESSEGSKQPARIVYHILMGAERYTWSRPAEEYPGKRQFGLDWATSPVREFPPRGVAIQHLEQAKIKTVEWIRQCGELGLATQKPLWPWTGDSMLAQGLYSLRHLQHHMGQLNIELRRCDLPIVEWK